MPFAAGVFSLVSGNPVVTGTTISSLWANTTLADIANNGLSLTVLKDGSQTITANIPMNSFKLTGLAAGTTAGDSVRYEQFFPTFNTTGPVNETKTTVASATTPDIWTSVGNVVDYTGTVTATGFAAAPQAGSRRTLVCAGAAVFTAGANMLIQGIASASNFTAAAGDQIDVVAITTTQFRLTVRRDSGIPSISTQTANTIYAGPTSGSAAAPTFRAPVGADGASLVLIQTQVASNSATIDFVTGITSAYDRYVVEITDLITATDNVSLQIRVSEDTGSTFKSGGTDYAYQTAQGTDGGATIAGGGSTGASAMNIGLSLSNAKAFDATVSFGAPASTSRHKMFKSHAAYELSGGTIALLTMAGVFKLDTNAINGIRFICSAGNITAGNFELYGVRKS